MPESSAGPSRSGKAPWTIGWSRRGPSDQPGIDGSISKRQDPADLTVNTIGIPGVNEFTEKITAGGGTILTPKTAIPGVGWFALCTDTEGNIFGIMEEDTGARQDGEASPPYACGTFAPLKTGRRGFP